MKTNQVIRIIIPVVLLLGAATAVIVAVLGSQQVTTSVDETQDVNQEYSGFIAFLYIDGVDGEAIEQNHQDWIEVLAYSHGVMIPSLAGTARTSGTLEHAPLRVTKMVDKSSPKLYEKGVTGSVIASVKLEFCKIIGEQLLWFYNIELQNAVIISVQDFGITAGDIPTETVSFSYEQIRWSYQEYDETGQSKGIVQTPWISVETGTAS